MKEEKGKLILVYVLMLLVIGLIVALTLVVLNNNPKNENKAVKNDHAPKIDVNPYPEISAECTFNLTIDEYNALTGPKCKNGYSRYNISNANIDGKNMLVTVIYNDLEGDKMGLFVNDRRVSNIVTNVTNYKVYVIDNKLFILDNNDKSNVTVYSKEYAKIYDLKETLDTLKLSEPAFTNVLVSTDIINPNSFVFNPNNFTFETQQETETGVQPGSTYQVNFTNEDFENPTLVNIN